MEKLNKYYFQGTRWIPGYDDFDYDDYEIEAASEAEAWTKLDKIAKYWKRVGITHINDEPIDKASPTS